VGKYPKAAILSFLITILLAGALYYFINRVYPDFNPIGEWLRHVPKLSDADYTFYSGPQGGTYNTIGKFVEGRFDGDDDAIHHKESSGSSENAMKIRVEGSAFGIVQEEDVRKDEDIKNHIKLITPLFLERMHIFYRKVCLVKLGMILLFHQAFQGKLAPKKNHFSSFTFNCVKHAEATARHSYFTITAPFIIG